ncbi:hypothetical protein ACVIWU_006460 [Bradyrhizobium sp. USDA 4509]
MFSRRVCPGLPDAPPQFRNELCELLQPARNNRRIHVGSIGRICILVERADHGLCRLVCVPATIRYPRESDIERISYLQVISWRADRSRRTYSQGFFLSIQEGSSQHRTATWIDGRLPRRVDVCCYACTVKVNSGGTPTLAASVPRLNMGPSRRRLLRAPSSSQLHFRKHSRADDAFAREACDFDLANPEQVCQDLLVMFSQGGRRLADWMGRTPSLRFYLADDSTEAVV